MKLKKSLFSLVLFINGCVTTSQPTIAQTIKTKQSRSESDSIIAAPTNLKLTWDYCSPMPVIGIGFDIETSPDIDNPVWTLYCTTNQPPVPIWPNNSNAYFRVGAHFD